MCADNLGGGILFFIRKFMQKYYISHEAQQMGPYTIDEIVGFVGQGTLSPLDYIYDESKSDWTLFVDHTALAEKVKSIKPKVPPKVHIEEQTSHVSSEINQHEWYVLKNENKFGPFAYIDIVKMLQQGVVFEFDFAWHKEMSGWERIAEIKSFDKETLTKLKDSNAPGVSEVFFRRRFRRVKYGATVLVHDNKKVWKGQGVEISEGGAGVIMSNAAILPGQELYLHFKPGDGVPPFNAICEVVSKQYVGEAVKADTPIRYGLKFKTVSSEAQKLLRDFTKTAA